VPLISWRNGRTSEAVFCAVRPDYAVVLGIVIGGMVL
jgi:hypothetical protein